MKKSMTVTKIACVSLLLAAGASLAQVSAPPPPPPIAQELNPPGSYRGPGALVPPNAPPPGNCIDHRPAACDLLSPTVNADAGCPDPALAVEWPVFIQTWENWTDPDGWECLMHPEGYFIASLSAQDVFDACTTARNQGLTPPMVDFVVDALFDVRAVYVYPHAALREYCVTHLSHHGPDNPGVGQPECNPNYDQPLTKPGNLQWPNLIGNLPGLAHLATETFRGGQVTTHYGFWDDPGTGQLQDYYTWNKHCAVDENGQQPSVDGGRIRFNCDCQEVVIQTIITANQDNATWEPPYDDDTVYWFYADP